MQPTDRTVLAVVTIVAAPYHVHLLRRLADELPNVEVHSLFSYDWRHRVTNVEPPPQVRPVAFSGATYFRGSRPRLIRGFLRAWREGGAMLAHLEQIGADAVIVNGYGAVSFLRVIAGARRRGIRVFLRGDSNIRSDDGLGRWRALAKDGVVRWVLKRVDGVMPVGTLGQEYFVKYGADPATMHLVPLEPDYEFFGERNSESAAAFLRSHSLDPARNRVLFVGRIAEEKRLDLLLDAFAAFAAARPDWDLVIAGSGPLESTMRKRVPARLEDRVTWLGWTDQASTRIAFQACDVLVLPSDFEPWALVVNEALAAGIPVVVSDVVGASADLVRQGVNGLIFRSGDVGALTGALEAITDGDVASSFSAAVPSVLGGWRNNADPVAGVRAALESVGFVV